MATIDQKLILRGMRSLDNVAHCQDEMTCEMWENDKAMRDTPPIAWTEEQVKQSEETSIYINERN